MFPGYKLGDRTCFGTGCAHCTVPFGSVAVRNVHFLSVYFFSVYTRPTSVELGGHIVFQFLEAATPSIFLSYQTTLGERGLSRESISKKRLLHFRSIPNKRRTAKQLPAIHPVPPTAGQKKEQCAPLKNPSFLFRIKKSSCLRPIAFSC